jgi:translation initiation factor IF-3
MGHPDNDPRLLGKQINVMISPHPANKRKLRFHAREGATIVAIPVQLGPMAVVAAAPVVKPAPGV